MIESLLVADRGLVAAAIIQRGQHLGIKCVAVGFTRDPDERDDADGTPDGGDVSALDAARLADDTVLLAGQAELDDPQRVIHAAQAGGVDAIHPGRGPLRSSSALAELARAAGLVPIVTALAGPTGELEARLRAGGLAAELDAGGPTPAGPGITSFVVLMSGGGARILGSTGRDGDLIVAPAPWATERDQRLAHAAAAVVGERGLIGVTVRAGIVVGLDAGLPEHFAATELVSGLDLVALQIGGADGTDHAIEATAHGVAVGEVDTELVEDLRRLTDDPLAGLRLDAVPAGERGHRAVVRATAWAEDRATAEAVLDRYRRRRR